MLQQQELPADVLAALAPALSTLDTEVRATVPQAEIRRAVQVGRDVADGYGEAYVRGVSRIERELNAVSDITDSSDEDDEYDEDENCDTDELSRCCGYCPSCEECHDDYDDYYDGVCESSDLHHGGVRYCHDCDHECDVKE